MCFSPPFRVCCYRFILITHADDSRGSKAFLLVCRWFTCICVCAHDKTKMAETKNHQTWHRDSPQWALAHQLILGQNVEGQAHRVTKCKKAIEWPVYFPASSYYTNRLCIFVKVGQCSNVTSDHTGSDNNIRSMSHSPETGTVDSNSFYVRQLCWST